MNHVTAGPDRDVRRALVWDGAATKTMESLAGGVVLAGLALHLGASDHAIGLLAALPLAAQLVQIPALRLVFRVRDRKRLCVAASAASRACLLLVAGVALLAPGPVALQAFFLVFAASVTLAAVGGLSWSYWMRDLIPHDQLGRTISHRLRAQGAVSVVFVLVSGVVIERITDAGSASLGYALLLGAGALVGFAGLAAIRAVPDVPLDPADAAPPFLELARGTWREERVRRPILFIVAFGFATTLAFPFLTVFLLTSLQLPFGTVTAFAAASLLASLLFYPIWGRLTDRFGEKAVLAAVIPILIATMLLLTTIEDASPRSLVILGVVHVVNGAILAALELASANLILKVAPPHRSGAFLAVAGAARAAASGTAAVVGGALATFFSGRSLAFDVAWTAPGGGGIATPVVLAHYDFVFVASGVILLFALHRLALVEVGRETPRRVVFRELQVQIQAASSVLAARTLSQIATHVTRHVHDRRKAPGPAVKKRPPQEFP
ncbi:MAG TPA: MFS transporter [Candidatus Thermoplasmatota archaeon]|nr:MFS transporter [Candidatus Thermoplasmatota archaeon]